MCFSGANPPIPTPQMPKPPVVPPPPPLPSVSPPKPIATCPGGREMMCQEEPMSCAIASTRMIIASAAKKKMSEKELREQSQKYPGKYDPINGTQMENTVELLKNNGVPDAKLVKLTTMNELSAATSCGNPTMLSFINPGGGGHAMVLDGVRTNPDGTKTAIIRDPWCGGGPSASDPKAGTIEMSEADMTKRGYNAWVVTNCA